MRAVHRLPGRIYPYYLLANLYAEPFFYQCDKLERMVQTVLEKKETENSVYRYQADETESTGTIEKVPEN